MLISNPAEIQVGGDHYKKLGQFEPLKVMEAWMSPEEVRGFLKGCAIKYLCREQVKGGIEDLKKARHYIDLLIDFDIKDMEKARRHVDSMLGSDPGKDGSNASNPRGGGCSGG